MRYQFPQNQKAIGSNVLILGNDYHDSLEVSYYNAFKDLGYTPYIYSLNRNHHNLKFNIINKFFKNNIKIRNINLIKEIDINLYSQSYEIIIFFSLTLISKDLILKLKKLSKKMIFIYADNPLFYQYKFREVLSNVKFFDYVFLWSQLLVKQFTKFNNNTHFLDFAWDPLLFPKSFQTQDHYKLIFMGGWDKFRENEILNLVKKNIDLEIYGPAKYWTKIRELKRYYKYEVRSSDASNIISNSINLNIQRIQNDLVSGLNMRVFETIGSGGILITKKHEQLKMISCDLYKYLAYEDTEDIIRIYNKILNNENFFNEIKYELNLIIEKQHTYINRAKEILRVINI